MLKSGLKFQFSPKKDIFLLWTIFLRLPKTSPRFSSNLSLDQLLNFTPTLPICTHMHLDLAPYNLLPFSTVNYLSKESQVRILAQTNIFFIIFIIFYLKMLLLYVKMAVLYENVINMIIFA